MQHDKTVMIPKLVSSLSCDIKQVSSSDGAIGKYGVSKSQNAHAVNIFFTASPLRYFYNKSDLGNS